MEKLELLFLIRKIQFDVQESGREIYIDRLMEWEGENGGSNFLIAVTEYTLSSTGSYCT